MTMKAAQAIMKHARAAGQASPFNIQPDIPPAVAQYHMLAKGIDGYAQPRREWCKVNPIGITSISRQCNDPEYAGIEIGMPNVQRP